MIPTIEVMTDNRSTCKICATRIKTGESALVFGSSAYGSHLSTAKAHLMCWVEKSLTMESIIEIAARGGEHHE